MDGVDFAHTDTARTHRETKATTLAAFAWDRGLNSGDIQDMSMSRKRALARYAGVNPPSTDETWNAVCGLLDRKDKWAQRNPNHTAAIRPYAHDRHTWACSD